jgi:apolipoprotein a
MTADGGVCAEWDTNEFPHKHRPESRPNAGLESNFCRNPDGDVKAWCYTTNPDIHLAYCEVPVCEKYEFNDGIYW